MKILRETAGGQVDYWIIDSRGQAPVDGPFETETEALDALRELVEPETTQQPIDEIHNHLKAGHHVAICTCTRIILLSKKHLEYIRASNDGKGFRLGWPGKKSLYCFAYQIRLVD